jgi:hypothetical protein
MNDDKNFLGRVLALALILGTAYGVRAIARGRFDCAMGGGSSCTMGIPAEAPAPAVDEKAAPVEKADADSGEDEDAKLQKKAPVEPPAPAEKAE